MSTSASKSEAPLTNQAPSSGEVVASEATPAEAVKSSDISPFFWAAFIVLATLPLGIGIGVACRAKAVHEVQAEVRVEDSPPPVHDEAASDRLAWRNQQRADDLFRAGDFRLALQLYQSKELANSLRPSDELSLKLAICHEAASQTEQALDFIQSVSDQASPDERARACFAQARIHLRRREFDEVRDTIRKWLSHSRTFDEVTEERRLEAAFLLVMTDLLKELNWDQSSDDQPRISPLDANLWLIPEVLNPALKNVQANSNSQTEGKTPTMREMVDSLLNDPSSNSSRPLAESLAEQFLSQWERHHFAGILRLILGEKAYQQGDLPKAAALFGDAAGKGSIVRDMAVFNQGIVQFQLSDYRSASEALGRFVDGVPGHEWRSRALLLRGRALLELGEGEKAAFEFQRAADVPGPDDVRAWAAAFVGFAYLQARQPKLAAEKMFHRRDRIQTEAARTAAGFAVSLARLETLEVGDSLDREALFMFRALSRMDPNAEWLGANGRHLIGRAYQLLHLYDSAAEVFERALQKEVREPFSAEMKLALAECYFACEEQEQARKWLVMVQQHHGHPWSGMAGIRLAKWELSQGHADECLAICRSLLRSEPKHSEILRLMGKAHELTGQDQLAAECFAGLQPQ